MQERITLGWGYIKRTGQRLGKVRRGTKSGDTEQMYLMSSMGKDDPERGCNLPMRSSGQSF